MEAGEAAGLGGTNSKANSALVGILPQRLRRLYLKRHTFNASRATAKDASLGEGLATGGYLAAGSSVAGIDATASEAAVVRAATGGSQSKGSIGRGPNGGPKSASSTTRSVSSSGLGEGMGGGGHGRRKRLAPVNLRVSTSPGVSQHAGLVMGSAVAVSAAAGVLRGAAEAAASDDLELLSDEGEQSLTIAADSHLLAGAEIHPALALVAPVEPRGCAAVTTAAPSAAAKTNTASINASTNIDTGTTGTAPPFVDPSAGGAITVIASAAAAAAAGYGGEGVHAALAGATSGPAGAAAGRPLADAGLRIPSSAQPTRTVAASGHPPEARSSLSKAPRRAAPKWFPADDVYVRSVLPTAAGCSTAEKPLVAPVMPPATPQTLPSASARRGTAAQEEKKAAPSDIHGGGAVIGGTCRIRMKLHSSSPEQLLPSMLAPLARLLLPHGWALRGLAVRSGCLEIVLEYARIEGGGARGGDAAAGAAAAADDESLFSDGQAAELVSYLHRQGLVDTSLESTVVVQVNQQTRRVLWQGHDGACGGSGGDGAGSGLGGGENGSGLALRGASIGLPSWCTGPVPPPPQGSAAAAAAAAAAATEGSVPPPAGGWVCHATPASAHAIGVGLGLDTQPHVSPTCVLEACTATAPPEAAAVLYIAVPSAGLHSCTVRCLGQFLPVQELYHLSAAAVVDAAVAAARSAPPPPPAALLSGPLVSVRRSPAHNGGGDDLRPPAAPAIDWAAAAAAAAAAGAAGEVFILLVRELPRRCALLQVELRSGGGAESWSSHVSASRDPHGQASRQLLPQPVGAAGRSALPASVAAAAPMHESMYGPPELLSAAAPVVLLRACACAQAALPPGQACCAARHGHEPVGAAADAAAAASAGICLLQEAVGAAAELANLPVRIRACQQASAVTSAASTEGSAAPAASTGALSSVAAAAAREFLNDLGLLLDAAACMALEEDEEEEDVAEGSGAPAATVHECPSYGREVRSLLLQQLGLSDNGAGAFGSDAAAVQVLRQHLADTAVTILAACMDLTLPYVARLVVTCAAHWLQLCTAEMLAAAVTAESGGAAIEAAAGLEALLRVTATGRAPSTSSLPSLPYHGHLLRAGSGHGSGDDGHGCGAAGQDSGGVVAAASVPSVTAAAGASLAVRLMGCPLPRPLSCVQGGGGGDAATAPPLASIAGRADDPATAPVDSPGAANLIPVASAEELNRCLDLHRARCNGEEAYPPLDQPQAPQGLQRPQRSVDFRLHGSGSAGLGSLSAVELGLDRESQPPGEAQAHIALVSSQPVLQGPPRPHPVEIDAAQIEAVHHTSPRQQGPPTPTAPSSSTSDPPTPTLLAPAAAAASAAVTQPVRYTRFSHAADGPEAAAAVATAAERGEARGAAASASVAESTAAVKLQRSGPEGLARCQGLGHAADPSVGGLSVAKGGAHLPSAGMVPSSACALQGAPPHQEQQEPGPGPSDRGVCSERCPADSQAGKGTQGTVAAPAAAAREAPETVSAAAPAPALQRLFGAQVAMCFTGFPSPRLEQAFWLDTTSRLQTMCRLYAGITLAFVSVAVVRAFFEDGPAAAAFMALYQGGQAGLLAGFGLTGDGRSGRLFGTVAACTALRAVCHSLLSRGLAPLPSFVLPTCRMWADVFNEGVAKAVFEQLPVWLFLTLLVFLELPTAYALYTFLDGHGAGLLSERLLLRLACFGCLKTAVVVGTQAAWRVRFLARRNRDRRVATAKLD